MSEHDTDPAKLPALGRMFLWVDKPGSANKLFWLLAAACAVVFLLDFTYEKHGHFHIEDFPGAYALYGFLCFTFIIFAAKTLRLLIKRPEDYYGDQDINAEETPENMLERVEHDGF